MTSSANACVLSRSNPQHSMWPAVRLLKCFQYLQALANLTGRPALSWSHACMTGAGVGWGHTGGSTAAGLPDRAARPQVKGSPMPKSASLQDFGCAAVEHVC